MPSMSVPTDAKSSPGDSDDVLDVVDHACDRTPPAFREVAAVEHDSDRAAARCDRFDLLVIDVAPQRPLSGDAGVGDDYRNGRVTRIENVEEPAAVDVRQVDEDAVCLQPPDEVAAE